MRVKVLLFLSLLFTAVAMAGGYAHLLELPNKLKLSAQEYQTVQQIYRGWSLLGIPIYLALLSILALAISLRADARAAFFAFTAFLCVVGSQVVFWMFTFPVNQQTRNWTVLPAEWLRLRNRWEFSHAAGALPDLLAVCALILAALARVR